MAWLTYQPYQCGRENLAAVENQSVIIGVIHASECANIEKRRETSIVYRHKREKAEGISLSAIFIES